MSITGTALLLLIFPPVDRVFHARVRCVEGLPFSLTLGTAFAWHYGSIIDFNGTGSFEPTKDSRSVPLLPPEPLQNPRPWPEQVHSVEPDEDDTWCSVPGWWASMLGFRTGRVRCEETGSVVDEPPLAADNSAPTMTQERFCALEWQTEDHEDDQGEEAVPPDLVTT